MGQSCHLVCPRCSAINRVPADKLAASPRCGSCHEPLFAAEPVALTDSTFERHVTRNDIPVLVDFWAEWCGPCKMMAPAFRQAAVSLESQVRLAKVDTEAVPGVAGRYQIRSIPTLILFRGGREVARQAGAMSAADIVRWTQAHL